MKLSARDFALMSFGDAWRNAIKGAGLSQEQRRILDFVCAKSRCELPARFTKPCLGRMFGCSVEKVREVFWFLEHRHLICQREARNGRKRWCRLSISERHERCADVLMEQTALLSELGGQEYTAADYVLRGSSRRYVGVDDVMRWANVSGEAAQRGIQCCEQCGLLEQVEPGCWKRTFGAYETFERWFGERVNNE